MAFIGKAGQIFEDVGKTITDDILGIDDSGGIIGSASNVLAQLDDTTRDILSNETIVTLTSIVLASNPATAWAVPLVQGASVAAQGGDIRDVLEASAKAYVAQQIGAEVGAGAEAAAVDAGFSATAGAVLGSATGSAAGAAVVGGDPKQAFITGGVTAAVPRIMYQSDTLRDIGQRMQVEDGMRVRGEQGPILNPVSVTERAMFNVIQGTATAALTGQDVDDALLASVIKSADLTANVIKDSGMLDDLSEGQAALVTDVVNNVARSALTGGNMDDAVMQAVTRAGAKALQDVLDQGVRNTIDNVSGAYEDVYGKARELEATDAAMQTAQTEYNRVYDRYEAERDALTVKRNLAVDAQARINKGLSVAQANAIIADYNAAVAAFDKKVKNYYNPELSAKGEVYQTLIDTAKTQTEEYNVLRDKLVSKADQLDSALNPVYSATNEFFVNAMDPDFNEVQYREINDIPDDVDAYEHWLEEGQFEGLKTNDNSLDAEIDDIAGALTIKALDDIADVTNYSSEDIADLKGKITADLKNKTVEEIRSAKATDYVNIARDNYTASDSVVSRASIKGGVTREDVVNGNARLVVGDNGLLQWDQVSFFGTPRWSAEHGQLVYYKPTSFGQTIITDLSGTKILERLPIELQIIVGGTLAETQTSNPNMFIETATELLDGASEATKNQLKETLGEEGYDYVANTLTAMKKNVANSYIIKSFAAAGIRGAGEISKAANDTLILAGINPSSSPLGKAANDMLRLGEKSTPQEFADRIEAFKKDYDSSEGPLGKLKAISDGFRNSPFEMLVNFVGVELFPEIVPVLVGGVASVATKVAVKNAVKNATEESIKAAGKKAGLTASGITDIIESVGGNAGGAYDEALQVALDSGMSEAEAYDYAYKVATSAGILGGMTTMVSMGVVGQPLAEAFLGGNKNPLLNEAVLSLTSKIIRGGKTGASITIREGLTESLEEATVTTFKEVLFYEKDPTRDVSGNIVGAAALAFISGGGTAGSIYGIKATGDMTSNAVRLFNRDVDSIISNSENSQSGANTAKQQLDDLGVTDSQIQGNLLNEVYDAGYTNQNEAVQSFNTYEYYTPTAEEISSFVGDVPDNVRDSRIESYIDPRYVDADEVRAIAEQEGLTLTDEQIAEYVGQKDESSTLNTAREAFDPQATTFGEAVGIFRDTYGYTPNAEEVNQFVGSIPEADQKIAIGEYVNPRQVTEAEARAFFEEQGYTATDEEIQQFVGEVNQEARKTEVGEYVDPRMVDADEVRAIAEQEGLTLTDEQIAEYVGQKDESSTLNTARKAFDPQATTYEEAEQIFRDTYGYTPNAEEVNQFVDNIPEADQKTAIGEYVNPRQVTEAEARAFFEEQGYTATGEEIQQFMGQVNQEARKIAIGEYVNPRQVTEAEARAFFEERGYTATDEEIQQFVGQVNQEARKTEVGEYVDPRMVDADEIRAIAEQEGLTLTDEQIAEYVGQKDESSTLNTARKAFDPQATTYEEAEQIFRDTYGYTPNAEEVNQFVDSIPEADQKTAIGEYVNPRQVTEAEARAFFEERGYTATDEEIQQFVGQVNQEARKTEVGEYVDPRMVDADEVRAAYETLGITNPTEADVEQFIGQYAESDLAGRAEEYLPTARYNSIIEQLDALAENMGQDQEILEAITASEEALGEQITDVEASILKKVAEYEEAGTTRDEALEKAIADVAGDLDTTEENLLEELGATEESLLEAITASEEALGEQITDVETGLSEDIGAVSEDVSNLAGIIGQPGIVDDPSTTDVDESRNPTGVFAEIDSLMAQGLTNAEAIAQVATDLGVAVTDLTSTINDVETGLSEDIGAVSEDVSNLAGTVGKPTVYNEDGDIVEEATGVFAEIDSLMAQGLTNAEAIAQTVGKPTVYNEDGDIVEEATGVFAEIDSLMAQGLTNAEAIAQVATDLGVAVTDLTSTINDVETGLSEDIGAVSEDVGTLAEIIGQPGIVDDPSTTDVDESRDPTGVFAEIDSLMAQGLTNSEAIAQVATDLGVAVTDLTSTINDVETGLSEDIGAVSENVGTLAEIIGQPGIVDDPSTTDVDESRDPTGLFNTIANYETAGQERDEAIQSALSDLATDLGTTEENLLKELGATEESLLDAITATETALGEQITDVETSILEKVAEYEEAGATRDEAIQSALSDLATDLGTTEENLLEELGATEESLLDAITASETALGEQITGVEETLGDDIQAVADLIGKPARSITDVDIDFVADLIAQQELLSDPTTYQFTEQDLRYDVTRDGAVTQEDLDLLTQLQQDPSLATELGITLDPNLVTDPTGVYKTILDTQTNVESKIEQTETALEAKIAEEAERSRMRASRGALRDFFGFAQQGAFDPQTTTVKSPDPAKIGYIYDFSSIFANPQQEALFGSPYAEGGYVEDSNEELLRLLRSEK